MYWNEKGFTLVEMMVSLSLVSGLCLTIIPVYTLQLQQRACLKEESIAMSLLQEEVRLYYGEEKKEEKVIKKEGADYFILWSTMDSYDVVRVQWKNKLGRQREEMLYAKE